MWSTRAAVATSAVAFAPAGGAPRVQAGEVIPFSNSGNVQTLHRVRLAGLAPGTLYNYTVGDAPSGGAQSAAYAFSTPPTADWSPTLAVYGDMGITPNGRATMPWLLRDAAAGALDVVVHIGDVAYDLQTNAGQVGDDFMTMIEPLAASTFYHLCPGNHVRIGRTRAARPPRARRARSATLTAPRYPHLAGELCRFLSIPQCVLRATLRPPAAPATASLTTQPAPRP